MNATAILSHRSPRLAAVRIGTDQVVMIALAAMALGVMAALAPHDGATTDGANTTHATPGAHSGHIHRTNPVAATPDHGNGQTTTRVVQWGLMCVVMMSPGQTPMIRFVRTRTLRRRRYAVPTVLAAYFATWIVVGIVVVLTLGRLETTRSIVAGCFVAAAAWQLTPAKRWAMLMCERPARLALRGSAAFGSEVRFGLRQGAACLASCWLFMLPMGFGVHPHALTLVGGGAVAATERLSSRPRQARRAGALMLLAIAATQMI